MVTEQVNNIFIVCLFCLLTSIVKNLTIYSDDDWGADESDSEEVYTHTEKIHTTKLSINVILVRGT